MLFGRAASGLLLVTGAVAFGQSVTITEYPVSTNGLLGITAGPDGALWFTEWLGDRIGRITTGQ